MNSVVHFELPADDLGRANAFYREAFGWTITSAEPDVSSGYQMAVTTPSNEKTQRPTEPGAINGGIFPRTSLLQHPDIMIDVPDMDATLEKVARSGGEVVREKRAAGDMGWSAYIKDTEGNVVGLWQSTMNR